MEGERFCDHCKLIISTPYSSRIKLLKQCSFFYQNTCNSCATNQDIQAEIDCIKRNKFYSNSEKEERIGRLFYIFNEKKEMNENE